jgi:radical SAM-linked protein
VRLRIRYAKLGKVRFTSHRDTAHIWERTMRKASMPVAISAGFTPRPRLSFGLALPTGGESVAEYLDVDLDATAAETFDDATTAAVPDRLSDALPTGFTALMAAPCDPAGGSLQESVTSVTWSLRAPEGVDVAATASRLLAAAELPLERERKGQRSIDDVRPQIVTLAVGGADGGGHETLVAELATIGRGLRPAELAALAFPGAVPAGIRAVRTHQWIEHDGARREVLSLPDVVSVPTVQVGA